jgi:predicted Zn-ribbon and HTH transcriptional regulator
MRVKCKYCGYSWNYKGKLKTACCPNCRHVNFIKKR